MRALSQAVETIGHDVVDASVKVHKAMGPGLLESVYEECLTYELSVNRGLKVQRQIELPVRYDGVALQSKLRLDMLINDLVIVEVKAVDVLLPIHEAQLITYLRLSGVRLGYIINFNTPLVKQGIKRMVL
jgi:GxxExxY protein